MKKVHFIILMLIVGISNIFAQQLVESIAAIVDKEIILRSEVEQFTQNYILQNRLKIRPGSEEYNQLRKRCWRA